MTEQRDKGEMGTALVTDHAFDPGIEGEWWRLCANCNLSEASHSATLIRHVLPTTYRCATCISTGQDVCLHGRVLKNEMPARLTEKPKPAVLGEGNTCGYCGGLMQRTGTCFTCGTCGTNEGGCG